MEGAFGRVGGEQRRVLAEELGALLCHSQTLGVMAGAEGSSEHECVLPHPHHYGVCPPDLHCGTCVTLPVHFFAPEPAVFAGVGAQRCQELMSLEESLT